MKRFFTAFLSIALVIILSACSGTAKGEVNKEPSSSETFNELPQISLSFATAAPESSSASKIMMRFKELVEKESNGKMTVDLFPNAQLGNDAELASSCLQGNISLVYQAASTHATLVPQASFFDTPFLTAGYDSAKIEDVVMNGEFRKIYNKYYDNVGFKLLTVKVVDSMNLSSNVPVYSVEDLNGLKVRVAQSESRMAFWQGIGANPTPLPYGELYMALQQGLVVASDNVYANMVSAKLVEQQKYVIPTNHMMPGVVIMMNKKLYDSLPEEYQKIIDNAAVETNHYDFEISREEQDEYFKQIVEEYKLQVCEVSDEFRKNMIDLSQNTINSVKKMVNDDQLYEIFVQELNK
jgi:tripartite ATP-independent transporter DctP family solute receptor